MTQPHHSTEAKARDPRRVRMFARYDEIQLGRRTVRTVLSEPAPFGQHRFRRCGWSVVVLGVLPGPQFDDVSARR